MSLSIDKIQNTESVVKMSLLQNYHTDCYIITYPLRWKMTPLQWKMRVTPPAKLARPLQWKLRVDPSDGK